MLCGFVYLEAGMSPDNVLAKNCLNSYKNSYLSQRDHKAFVYARERDTGKDRCNWAYGYSSIEEAIESAMKGCQSVVLNAECKVVDKDGLFDVSEGAFTKLVPIDDTPLGKEERAALHQEAKGVIRGNCLPFFEKNYLSAKGHKAFAYSIDANGNYACGYAYGHSLIEASKKQAIKSCGDNKLKRGNKAPKSPCKVYAVDKKIVLSLSDLGIDIEPKKDRFLSSDEYDKQLSLAKEIIGGGGCLMHMKYYLRGKTQQAFYFAKSGTKQACGRKEEAFTMKQAKVEAKKSCEKMASQKEIRSGCKLLAVNYEIVGKPSDFGVPREGKEDFAEAIHKGDIKKIKYYITKGYDVNTVSPKEGTTALFVAAAKGEKELFDTLIQKGADVKHKSKDGSTLLIAAVMGGNEEIVKSVLDKGLDVNAKGFGGNTALHVAAMKFDKKMAALLKAHGADETITNDKGMKASLDTLVGEMKQKVEKLVNETKNPKEQKGKKKSTEAGQSMPLADTLQLTAKTLNKDLPKMIDAELRFDHVDAKWKQMSFAYTLVHQTRWSMPPKNLRDLIYDDIKTQVCSDKESQGLLENGMVVSYKYRDKDKKPIDTFIFDAKACGLQTKAQKLMHLLRTISKKK